MPDDEQPANASEGADPSGDIKKQNPDATTTSDLAETGMPNAETKGDQIDGRRE